MAYDSLMVFTGNANPGLAGDIAAHLGSTLGAADVGRFSDGEVTVEIKQNVRTRDVFVVQSTCAPTNDNLMELLIMMDALRRASAKPCGMILTCSTRVMMSMAAIRLLAGPTASASNKAKLRKLLITIPIV